MNRFLVAEGNWHALVALAGALLVLVAGGWLWHRLAPWVKRGWTTWELVGTPLCRVTLRDWVTLSIAVVCCTLVFVITFVPLIPFWFLTERWRARHYYMDLAPDRGQRK